MTTPQFIDPEALAAALNSSLVKRFELTVDQLRAYTGAAKVVLTVAGDVWVHQASGVVDDVDVIAAAPGKGGVWTRKAGEGGAVDTTAFATKSDLTGYAKAADLASRFELTTAQLGSYAGAAKTVVSVEGDVWLHKASGGGTPDGTTIISAAPAKGGVWEKKIPPAGGGGTLLATRAALSAYTGGTAPVVAAGGSFWVPAAPGAAVNTGIVLADAQGRKWERVVQSATIHVDWFIDSWADGVNHAPAIQAALDATPPNGTLVFGFKGKDQLYQLRDWVNPNVMPDGTRPILYRSKPIHIIGGNSAYGGHLGYYGIPATKDIFGLTSTVVDDGFYIDGAGNKIYYYTEATYHPFIIEDLSIIAQDGSPTNGRHPLHISVKQNQGMSHLFIRGGQFRTVNPNARAIQCTNTGDAGIYASEVRDVTCHGGTRWLKLGDSFRFTGGVYSGPNWGIEIQSLNMADGKGASAEIVVDGINVTGTGGGVYIRDATTFHIRDINAEFPPHKTEGTTQVNGKSIILVENCGRSKALDNAGRAYSGSTILNCKANPTDGVAFADTAGAYGVRIKHSRGIRVQGGSIGGSQMPKIDNSGPESTPRAIYVEDSDDIVIDHPDLQVGPGAQGIFIDENCRNVKVMGYTINNVVSLEGNGIVEVFDQGKGTIGVVTTPATGAAYTPVSASGDELFTYQIDLSGNACLRGGLRTTAPVSAYTQVLKLPHALAPDRNAVRVAHLFIYDVNSNITETRHIPFQIVGRAAGAAEEGKLRPMIDVPVGVLVFDMAWPVRRIVREWPTT